MKSKRIKWLDFAKGITILGVLLLHTSNFVVQSKSSVMNYIMKFINFLVCIPAMPVFFAISGYLYKPTPTWKKYKTLLYKKTTSFVIPYIVFTLVMVFKGFMQHSMKSVFGNHILWPAGYLWFLYSLFFIFLIVGLLDLLHINIYIQLALAIIFMFSQMIWPASYPFAPYNCMGSYMICFYLGYMLKRLNVVQYLKHHFINIYLTIAWLLVIIISYVLSGEGHNPDLLTTQNWFLKLFSIITFFAIFASSRTNTKMFKYFDKYGKYTLVIYLIHYPVVNILNSNVVKHLLLHNGVQSGFMSCVIFIGLVIIGWYVSIFMCILSKKFTIINFIFYPRKYFNKLFSRA